MRILIVNKFLFPNGGSETYIFELGKQLVSMGHEVQYFGMEHPDRCVGNSVGAYTTNMDFHGGSKLAKLTAPFKIIYSREARKKIRLVLDDFRPDVVHLNNINFQITPSIIYEIRKWKKGSKVKIISTIHDPQWVCPNHKLINGRTGTGCDKCLDGHFMHCTYDRCIHSSVARSYLGTIEATLYKQLHTYRNVDMIITPSHFMENVINKHPDLVGRVKMLRNFIEVNIPTSDMIASFRESLGLTNSDKRYVLYLGRYSEEKGICTLIKAARALPQVQFVFAGSGPFESEVNSVDNIVNLGFVSGDELYCLLSGAEFSLIASECYENCPFTVMESQMCGTPVIGADIGGIPELIAIENESEYPTGELFKSGDAEELEEKILKLWCDENKIEKYSKNCNSVRYDSLETYTKKLLSMILEIK